jgi:hypothetical protein
VGIGLARRQTFHAARRRVPNGGRLRRTMHCRSGGTAAAASDGARRRRAGDTQAACSASRWTGHPTKHRIQNAKNSPLLRRAIRAAGQLTNKGRKPAARWLIRRQTFRAARRGGVRETRAGSYASDQLIGPWTSTCSPLIRAR